MNNSLLDIQLMHLHTSMLLLSFAKKSMAGPMSRKTWSAPWWLRTVPGSVSEFGERFGSLVSPGEPGYSVLSPLRDKAVKQIIVKASSKSSELDPLLLRLKSSRTKNVEAGDSTMNGRRKTNFLIKRYREEEAWLE